MTNIATRVARAWSNGIVTPPSLMPSMTQITRIITLFRRPRPRAPVTQTRGKMSTVSLLNIGCVKTPMQLMRIHKIAVTANKKDKRCSTWNNVPRRTLLKSSYDQYQPVNKSFHPHLSASLTRKTVLRRISNSPASILWTVRMSSSASSARRCCVKPERLLCA